jgi:hypothetical protein
LWYCCFCGMVLFCGRCCFVVWCCCHSSVDTKISM